MVRDIHVLEELCHVVVGLPGVDGSMLEQRRLRMRLDESWNLVWFLGL